MNNSKIEISWKTIVFTIFFLLFLKFVWIMRDLFFSLFIAFILMSSLKPYVVFLVRKGTPRLLAVSAVFATFLILFFFLLFIVLPPLIYESALLVRALPDIIESISPQVMTLLNLESLFQYIPNVANQFFEIIKGIFSNALFLISTLFFGFYFLLEENIARKLLHRFLTPAQSQQTLLILDRAEKRLNGWFWGEIALMTVVGVITFIGLNLIGIKYSLALAVVAGLLEAIPNFGPVFSAVPAALIGFSHSPLLGLTVIALYFIVQQVENNLLVPIVMSKAVGLNPIVTLIALIIGGKIGGVLGLLLSIPVTVFIETILLEVVKPKKIAENLR